MATTTIAVPSNAWTQIATGGATVSFSGTVPFYFAATTGGAPDPRVVGYPSSDAEIQSVTLASGETLWVKSDRGGFRVTFDSVGVE